jgi:Holliday junction resolvase RusA-like endonuclease
MKTKLTLHCLPPSVNHIYRHTRRGVMKTEAYRAWANGEGYALNRQLANQKKFSGPVYVTIAMKRPSANSDIDNRLKGIGDLLQEIGAIANDKHIMGWNAFWFRMPPGIAAEISIVGADEISIAEIHERAAA